MYFDSFFEQNDEEKDIKNKIILEYTKEEYNQVIDAFAKYKGKSKENVIWELLGL